MILEVLDKYRVICNECAKNRPSIHHVNVMALSQICLNEMQLIKKIQGVI